MNSSMFDCLDHCFPGIKATAAHEREIGFLWEDVSKPFLIEENGKVIAHAGVTSFFARMKGKEKKLGDIHAVCTHPEFRNSGNGAAVFQKALNYALEHYSTVILFSGIPTFYQKWGFKVIPEYSFHYQCKVSSGQLPCFQLMANDPSHVSIFKKILQSREPLSNTFCILDHGNIIPFNALFTYPKLHHLHYCPEIETIVAWEIAEGTLKIYDLLAKKLPSLESLLRYVPAPVEQIAFFFSPDKLVAKAEPVPCLYDNSALMVLGEWNMDLPLMVQPLSRC